MTTPNIEELIAVLEATNQFHDNADICTADVIATLQTQAERIKALEAECEVERLRLAACGVAALGYFNGCKDEYKSASLDDVLRLNKRCTDLRAELDSLAANATVAAADSQKAYMKLLGEDFALRAELKAIAATEPDIYVHQDGLQVWGAKNNAALGNNPNFTAYFTRPMPAQDVTELMEALEKLARLGNGEHYGNSDGNMIARKALSKYKGAR